MKYTVRFAHLKNKSKLKIGERVRFGDKIGTMGSSGQSTAAHLHLDCARGEQKELFHLFDYDQKIIPAPKQLLYFIDNDLFKVQPVITTPYADHEYFKTRKKVHHGFDVVPWDRKATEDHFDIYWNRSKEGTVLLNGYDPAGYGNYIYIMFEV